MSVIRASTCGHSRCQKREDHEQEDGTFKCWGDPKTAVTYPPPPARSDG